MAREASSTHPPASRENTPSRGVALLLGGQNPKTLEYQIYPPSTSIDTLVTGMTPLDGIEFIDILFERNKKVFGLISYYFKGKSVAVSEISSTFLVF